MLFIEYITFFRVIITLTNFGELISENKIFVWSIRDIVGDKTARNSQIVSTMVFPLKILMMWRNTCPWSSKPNLKMRTEWCKSRCRNVLAGRRGETWNRIGWWRKSRQAALREAHVPDSAFTSPLPKFAPPSSYQTKSPHPNLQVFQQIAQSI